MDVFKVHEQVIADYRAFTSGSSRSGTAGSRRSSTQQFAEGVQWPDPWLSLNPSFASGGAVPELVDEGLLHPECERIFRRKNDRARPRPGPDRAAPAPARGDRGRPHRRELRADHRHRLGQVAGLHRADRRPVLRDRDADGGSAARASRRSSSTR